MAATCNERLIRLAQPAVLKRKILQPALSSSERHPARTLPSGSTGGAGIGDRICRAGGQNVTHRAGLPASMIAYLASIIDENGGGRGVRLGYTIGFARTAVDSPTGQRRAKNKKPILK